MQKIFLLLILIVFASNSAICADFDYWADGTLRSIGEESVDYWADDTLTVLRDVWSIPKLEVFRNGTREWRIQNGEGIRSLISNDGIRIEGL